MDKKTKLLEVTYSISDEYEFEELGIDPKKVKSYYIKYTTLYIEFKDGTKKEYQPTRHGEEDKKSPETIREVDKNFEILNTDKII